MPERLECEVLQRRRYIKQDCLQSAELHVDYDVAYAVGFRLQITGITKMIRLFLIGIKN